ncbi:MAG TPA: hypothetical protein VK040_00705 [Balneolaceae bacterium]|nr:hypothetical protein [Balneolaceae bacterium]
MVADVRAIPAAELYDRLCLAGYDSIEGFTRFFLNRRKTKGQDDLNAG